MICRDGATRKKVSVKKASRLETEKMEEKIKAEDVFDGIKVLDLSSSLTGMLVTKVLVEHGATVILVESRTHPYITRVSAPFSDNVVDMDGCGLQLQCNGKKLSIGLNLGLPRGLEVLKRLAGWADIIVQSQRPGVMKKWGIDYETIFKTRPDIIILSIALEGQTGPRYEAPGWGIGMKGLQALVHFTGWPDRDGVGVPLAYSNSTTPFIISAMLIAALDYRQKTGRGQHIDFSQYEAALHFVPSFQMLDYYANDRIGTAQGNRSSRAAPHGAFRCKGDDRWCVISVTTDEQWHALCRAMGSPEYTRGDGFATILSRKKNEDELERLIEKWTINFSAEEVINRLQKEGVPSGIVQNSEDLLDKDPQLKHRQFYRRLKHPRMGGKWQPVWPFKLSKTPCEPGRVALFGEHTEHICRGILKMGEDEFASLLSEGVLEIGQHRCSAAAEEQQ